MGSEPRLVSVIIPTYNHAHFLELALRSVQAQTYTHWQAVVVNNFSTDDTEGVIRRLADPRIQLVNFRNHGIIASSRNEGLRHAAGEIVAFLDSDDAWYPDKLRLCVEALAGRALVGHRMHMTKGDAVWVSRHGDSTEELTYSRLLYEANPLITSSVVTWKAPVVAAGGFSERPEHVTAEDYDLWLRLAQGGASMAILGAVLGSYALHQGNASAAAHRNLAAARLVVLYHYKQQAGYNGPVARALLRRRLALLDYTAARSYQHAGQRWRSIPLLLSTLCRAPTMLKTYAALLLTLTPPMLGRKLEQMVLTDGKQ